MYFADWLWVVIAQVLGLKTIPDLLDTNSTHTGIAHAHLTTPHTCDYMGYLRHLGNAARSSKNLKWLLELQYANFSLNTRSGITAHILRQTQQTGPVIWSQYHNMVSEVMIFWPNCFRSSLRFWTFWFLGEMQRIAFRLMLSSCVCVCLSVCIYTAFVNLGITVWDTDVVFFQIARNDTGHNLWVRHKSEYKFKYGGQNGGRETL